MIVYFDWEGRGYELQDLIEDLKFAEEKLSPPGTTDFRVTPIYYAYYDVGVLLTTQMPPDFTKVVVSVRDTEDWISPGETCQKDLLDGDGMLDPSNWYKADSIGDMLWKWAKEGILT